MSDQPSLAELFPFPEEKRHDGETVDAVPDGWDGSWTLPKTGGIVANTGYCCGACGRWIFPRGATEVKCSCGALNRCGGSPRGS